MKIIDDRRAHNQVLFELGLLDDDDDWPMYLKQEERFPIADEGLKYLNASLAERQMQPALTRYQVGSTPTRRTT